jgi:hypothetical protein
VKPSIVLPDGTLSSSRLTPAELQLVKELQLEPDVTLDDLLPMLKAAGWKQIRLESHPYVQDSWGGMAYAENGMAGSIASVPSPRHVALLLLKAIRG